MPYKALVSLLICAFTIEASALAECSVSEAKKKVTSRLKALAHSGVSIENLEVGVNENETLMGLHNREVFYHVFYTVTWSLGERWSFYSRFNASCEEVQREGSEIYPFVLRLDAG